MLIWVLACGWLTLGCPQDISFEVGLISEPLSIGRRSARHPLLQGGPYPSRTRVDILGPQSVHASPLRAVLGR